MSDPTPGPSPCAGRGVGIALRSRADTLSVVPGGVPRSRDAWWRRGGGYSGCSGCASTRPAQLRHGSETWGAVNSRPASARSSGSRAGDSIVYQRSLRVEIDRLGGAAGSAPAGTPAGPGAAGSARVFEARAVSEGPSASLAPVMRAMVQAIFEDFPGPSGKTRTVSVPFDRPM